ncbi:polysaccharide deacetylase family protein [Methylomonas sp. 2BW1-5-20]|uniref:polysaccharide deacetylase family protein n=1 Tax=Methylomonas sp. 2BW1-5-20 TaxID=3376686 RepID=UPI00404E0D32
MSQYRSPIVLMYHGTPDSQPDSHYSIRADLFAKHLGYLKQAGWKTALFKDLRNVENLPEKSVVLTFDDGYDDNYLGAFLPLLEHEMKATWFIATDCISGHAHWLGKPSMQTRMLNSERLLEMHTAGMEIASHTCSHPDLSILSLNQQQAELSKAKSVLEDLLSTQVTSLAYPFGRFNADSVTAAEKTGYNLACTTRPGWFGSENNPYMIRRIAIFSGDSASTLARKLTFADNDVSWKKMARYYAGRAWDKLSRSSWN